MRQARAMLATIGLALWWAGVPGAGTASAAPPRNVAAPALSGPARVGTTLRTTQGRWDGSLDAVAFRWERCARDGRCAEIVNARTDTYAVGPEDAASTLRSRVTGTRAGASAVALSAPSRRIGPEAPALAASTAGTEAAFAFLGEDGARFECRLDDRAPEPCTSPVRHAGLAEGAHRFAVAQIGSDLARSPLAGFEWSIAPADPSTGGLSDGAEAPFDPPLDDPLPPFDPETDFGAGPFFDFGPANDDLGDFPEGSAGAEGLPGGASEPGGANGIRVAARYQRRLRTVTRRGARLTVRCRTLCAVTARLTLSARAARPLRLRLRRPLLVATRAAVGSGALKLLLKPRPRAASVLRRARRRVTLDFRVTAGSASRTARVILRP